MLYIVNNNLLIVVVSGSSQFQIRKGKMVRVVRSEQRFVGSGCYQLPIIPNKQRFGNGYFVANAMQSVQQFADRCCS